MAVAYSALVNGGDYIKPTVIEAIYSPNQQQYIQL
jgi:cell division protein FtsI/penicillin-binding protein 2